MSKRCELQKEYYQAKGNYKGTGKYSDDYVAWLENEVLALRQPLVVGRSEQLQLDEEANRCKRCQCYGCVCDALDGI
jgi:hypothetical protein